MNRPPRAGRVLLVENDAGSLETATAAFDAIGVGSRIDVMRTREEALDYLLRRGTFERRPGGDPLLILLSLDLPGRDGFAVLRECKADPRLQVIPVVVVSGSQNQADVATCYDLGANAYVVRRSTGEGYAATLRELANFWILLNEPPPDGLSIHAVSR